MRSKLVFVFILLFSFNAYAGSWYSSWSGIKAKVKEFIASVRENVTRPAIPISQNTPSAVVVKPVMEREVQEKWHAGVEQVKSQKNVTTVSPGRKSNDKNLVIGRNNIPVFEFKKYIAQKIKIKKVVLVPLLDVGEEATLDPNSYKVVELEKFPTATIKEVQIQTSPRLMAESEIKLLVLQKYNLVQKPEKIDIPSLEEDKKVTKEKINNVVFNPESEEQVVLLAVNPLGEEDLKMLRGLILYEKKDLCHIASGIFSDLISSQNVKIQNSSRYHLASCLQVMNLPTEAIYEYIKVLKSGDSRFVAPSIDAASTIAQRHHEDTLVEALKDDKIIPKVAIDTVNYLRARYAYRKNQYNQSLSYSEKVSSDSKKYYRAQYLAAISEFMLGKASNAESRLKRMIADLTKRDNEKDVLALAQVNLGRIDFQRGKFKDALDSYKNLTKDNSLWLQALTEQGWAQLQAKDAPGAIGNMHSIQSPFFESVYKPESYIVRGIGYLNICQYADAFKSISYLDQRYSPWYNQIVAYNKKHGGEATYSSVAKFLATKGKSDTDGLPNQVLREIARQRDFLNKQESINSLIDEYSGYPFVKTLIEKDKRILTSRKHSVVTKIVILKDKIKNANKTVEGRKNLGSWRIDLAANEDFLATYDFKMATYKEGEEGLKKMIRPAQNRIQAIKETNKEAAGKILRNYLTRIAKELKQNLENNELLKYEIYAGSGENIRYHVAGGKSQGKTKVIERKTASQNWDFQGEFWEDEIGNYRSSLKNNCKKEN